jgi:hypothetical protein
MTNSKARAQTAGLVAFSDRFLAKFRHPLKDLDGQRITLKISTYSVSV